MTPLLQDARHAARMLLEHPAFTAVAVSTLALGIGANALIFSGVHSVLWRDLPYPEPERLVVAYRSDGRGTEKGVSYSDFVEWKSEAPVFSELAAARVTPLALAGTEEAERVTGAFVSSRLMPMLAGRAGVGRTLEEDDFRPGSARVVVVSDTLWQRRLGGNAQVIGRRLSLDAKQYTVIGVMPPAFAYPFRAELWLPLEDSEAGDLPQDANANQLEILARLRPGATRAQAASGLMALDHRSSAQRPLGDRALSVRVEGLRDTLPSLAKYRRASLVLQLAVALVLLIACVNLANLLLARNLERQQELALRMVLGSGPAGLTRLLLVEALLLGLLGAVAGLLLASWGLHVLQAAISWRPIGLTSVELDAPVLLVTLCTTLLTVVSFGLGPGLLASRMRLEDGLSSATGRTTPGAGARIRKGLVVGEIAMAVALLAASAAMMRTLVDLTAQDPGFEPKRAVTLSLAAAPTRDTTGRGLALYFEEAVSRIRAVPGVEVVGGVSHLPLTGYNPGTDLTIEGGRSDATERVDFRRTTPLYFEAMGIPLVRGRCFAEGEMVAAPAVVLVNEALARRAWPNQEAVGQRLRLPGRPEVRGALTVVGVVGNLRPFGADDAPRPELYLPSYHPTMTLIIRTSGDPALVLGALREAARNLTRRQAPFDLRPMTELMASWMASRRIIASLLGAMAGVALLLTALGVYGVVSHQTLRRRKEMGVRMVLGARAADVFRLVLGEGLVLAAAGVVCGLAGAYGMLAVLRILPFRLSALDPLTLLGVALTAGIVTLLACYPPARRAARVDPMVALRCE